MPTTRPPNEAAPWSARRAAETDRQVHGPRARLRSNRECRRLQTYESRARQPVELARGARLAVADASATGYGADVGDQCRRSELPGTHDRGVAARRCAYRVGDVHLARQLLHKGGFAAA